MSEIDPFSTPSAQQGLAVFEDCNVLIIPREYIPVVKTTNGDKDAVQADIVNLDDEDGPRLEEDVRIFSMTLVGKFKRSANYNEAHDVDPATGHPKMTIGYLYRDVENQKKGQNAAWALKDVADEVKVVARKWCEDNKPVPADPFA